MSRAYTLSPAARRARRTNGRRPKTKRSSYLNPQDKESMKLMHKLSARDALLRKKYRAALHRISAAKTLSLSKGQSPLQLVGRFNPKKESFPQWWLRFQEAQRPAFPQRPPEAA